MAQIEKPPERYSGSAIVKAAFVLILAALPCSCSRNEGDASRSVGKAVPVTFARAEIKDVPYECKTYGTVNALASVDIKSQVPGILKEVHVKKGQFVKKGDLLFSIDNRPYRMAFKQAKANRDRDIALEAFARKEADSIAELFKKGVSTRNEYDKYIADADALKAAVAADDEAMELAGLQLERCSISSPIEGKIGNIFVSEGNLIKIDDVPLATVNQISPIEVLFSIPQQDIGAVKKYMREGVVRIRVTVPPEDAPAEVGDVHFMDNAVDKATGTIQVGAILKNNEDRLVPGQYVRVSLVLTTLKAVVIPAMAVQNGRDGKYVYVINSDDTVAMRPVTVAMNSDGRAVIQDGLAGGERVVARGQIRLSPGKKVEVVAEEMKAADAQPASQTAKSPLETLAATRPAP